MAEVYSTEEAQTCVLLSNQERNLLRSVLANAIDEFEFGAYSAGHNEGTVPQDIDLAVELEKKLRWLDV